MINWMLWTKNDLRVSYRKQFNAPSNMKLEKSLINFEYHPWGIWRFIILSRIWSHWSYYIFIYFRVGIQDKEVSLLILHGCVELSFSNILHWSYLLMFFQQGRLYESLREDVPKKSHRHSKRPWNFWIWDCRIFCQEWKWTYDWNPGSGILCYWVTKVCVHHIPTRHSHLRRMKGYLHISLSLWAW